MVWFIYFYLFKSMIITASPFVWHFFWKCFKMVHFDVRFLKTSPEPREGLGPRRRTYHLDPPPQYTQNRWLWPCLKSSGGQKAWLQMCLLEVGSVNRKLFANKQVRHDKMSMLCLQRALFRAQNVQLRRFAGAVHVAFITIWNYFGRFSLPSAKLSNR